MNKPLNIGVVANSAFNIYNYRLGLIHALKKEGHNVIAIAPEDNYTTLLKEHFVECIEIKNLARKGTNPFNDFKLMNEFRKIYKQQHLDVVLQYTIKPNIYGTLAASLSGTKCICTVTGLGYTFLNKSIASKVAFNLYRFAFSFANKVLFQNKDDEQTFVSNKLVKKSKTSIVPGSGIDTNFFHPDFCKEKTDSIFRFLMIGRLLKDKGVYEYIESAKRITASYSNVEFHLIGEVDNQNPSAILQSELEDWIQKNDIIFHKHTKDIRPYICTSDCIVLPSYREGMPRAILEGMAMAKLCITSDAPGCKEALIDDESGYLCKTADVNSLHSVMQKVMAVPIEKQKTIRLNARKRAEEVFSSNTIHTIYVELIRKIAKI